VEFITGSATLLLFFWTVNLLRWWFAQSGSRIRLMSAEVVAVALWVSAIGLRHHDFAFGLFLASTFFAITIPVFWREAISAPRWHPVTIRPPFNRAGVFLWAITSILMLIFLNTGYLILSSEQFRLTTLLGSVLLMATTIYVVVNAQAWRSRGNAEREIGRDDSTLPAS
jgi:hypothetical protein